ncbi:Trehalose 6-phosphate phosphorylase [hydrothermal vent metagenome]|uniref:Beta-phosphoglucomutase n=1 Tax=hydrothermal vent metagenome TaxID=652676 RepID=A0A3B0WIW7_9ZZZZ
MDKNKFSFEAVIFDLDGVITKTALVHASAWKVMFDEYLQLRQKREGEPFKAFTHEQDYLPYVDGKPRYKGVQDFLESRNIHIPFGDPTDSVEQETVCGLGNRKNIKFREVLERDGVEEYASTVTLIKALKANDIHVGVASSSKNCQFVLQSAGLEELFETRVDGVVSVKLGLKGKPEGDIFVRAAENMGVNPGRSVVVEDAVSGVQAGQNGGFGLVIGVARENNEEELKSNGADVVITDFENILTEQINQWFQNKNT